MARDTLRALEQGDPGVSLGSLANVLNALGLAKELSKLAVDDETGRMLQDARLEQRVRPARPRTRKPPRGTVDLVSLVEANPSEAKGPALVWNAERSWIQTFMPGEPPRERALDALGLGEPVTIMEVVSTGGPIFVLIKTEEGDERVVMLADLRREVASRK